jgi:predicted metal-dependent enzyme (double-stranded beta helix superfamily)
MFDTDTFVSDCFVALKDADPRHAVRELLVRTVSDPGSVADVLSRPEGGIEIVHNSPELTVLNVIWAPGMVLYPHEHRMWAAIGIYGGIEDNTLYQRGRERIRAAGGRQLLETDVLGLGADAIHSVANPERRFTGAIHVYGGDFVNEPRSQWDPDTLVEEPYDLEQVRRLFAQANADWAAQLGHDLDEEITS